MMMDDYKISDDFNGVEGSKMISPHHFHPTNGGSPSDSYPVKPEKCRTFPFEWSNPDSAEVCLALAKAKTRRDISK